MQANLKHRLAFIPFILVIMLYTYGCSSAPRYIRRTPVKGNPGEFTFEEQVGNASYYGAEFHGKPTSSGEIFDMNALTAAHRTLPLGTMVRVTNLENEKQVEVKINDRGPFVKGRIIDLSRGAAEKLEIIENGTAIVKIEIISN